MIGKTKEGREMAEYDNWKEKGPVAEPHPWTGITTLCVKEPSESDGNTASSSGATGGCSGQL